ncbi:hypothetical protein LTR17_026407 [Elasticomyces elasticus]|nr:hypothetical protein LTR17_026407 [Elasticomyces elasticus]
MSYYFHKAAFQNASTDFFAGLATGTQSSGPVGKCRATQTTARFDLLIDGEPCFIDIEFQGYKRDDRIKYGHRIGRICILNSKGDVVLDVYAIYPREAGQFKKKPNAEFGVTKEDLLYENGGVAAHRVERWVAEIVKNRIVIMHGGQGDLAAFYYEQNIWATSTIVDTQVQFSDYQDDKTPGLKTLAYHILNQVIQESEHSPVEDAEAMRKIWFTRNSYDRDAALASGAQALSYCEPSYIPYTYRKPQKPLVHPGTLTGSAKKKAQKLRVKAAKEAAQKEAGKGDTAEGQK